MLSKFKNDFKVFKNKEDIKVDASLIIFPHEKNWIPKLENYNYSNKDLNLNLINNTLTSNKILSNKKSLELIHDLKKSHIHKI